MSKSKIEMKTILSGISWKVISCFCFAVTNVLVRYLSGGSLVSFSNPISVANIISIQYLFGLIFLLPILKFNNNYKEVSLIKFPALNMMRLVTSISGIYIFYTSIKYIPIPEATALGFLSPVITVILAIVLLQERITKKTFFAIILSILGSYAILRPDKQFISFSKYGLYCLLPILSAVIFAIDKIIVRKLLLKGDSPMKLTILLMFCLSLTNVGYLSSWKIVFNGNNIILFLLLGFLATMAIFSFNKAYQYSKVTFLMPVGMVKLIFSVALSYIIFNEIPTVASIWIGIGLIFVSTLILSFNQDKK